MQTLMNSNAVNVPSYEKMTMYGYMHKCLKINQHLKRDDGCDFMDIEIETPNVRIICYQTTRVQLLAMQESLRAIIDSNFGEGHEKDIEVDEEQKFMEVNDIPDGTTGCIGG